MAKIPCPHCGEELTVNLEAVGSSLVCPKCHVILRLAKDDGEKTSLFDLRRLLRRRKIAVGLACAVALLLAFAVGFRAGSSHSQTNGRNRGIVMNAFGLFFAHNELHVNDGAKSPPQDEK
jgi:uncharacterized RDD family membrane protein YckC